MLGTVSWNASRVPHRMEVRDNVVTCLGYIMKVSAGFGDSELACDSPFSHYGSSIQMLVPGFSYRSGAIFFSNPGEQGMMCWTDVLDFVAGVGRRVQETCRQNGWNGYKRMFNNRFLPLSFLGYYGRVLGNKGMREVQRWMR